MGSHEVKLDKVWDELVRQQGQLDELRTENLALRTCLAHIGIVSRDWFEIEVHRIRFASVQRRHPAELNNTLRSIMEETAVIPLKVGQFAGNAMFQQLCATSIWHDYVCTMLMRVSVLGGTNLQKVLTSVERLNVRSEIWEPIRPMRTARTRTASATVMGKLYIMGGLAPPQQALGIVESFDLVRCTWELDLPRMLTPRAASAASAVGEEIFVFGGSQDGRHFLSTAETFNLESREWNDLPEMSGPRGSHAAVSFGRRIYALGGCHERNTLPTCECFDPETELWYTLPPMRLARQDFAASVSETRIFVIGGFTDGHQVLDSVECFVLKLHHWESMPSLPAPRAACASVVSRGARIYVFGGTDGQRVLNTVQCLRLGQPQWCSASPMQERRMAAVVATCDVIQPRFAEDLKSAASPK